MRPVPGFSSPETCPIENVQKGACTLYMHDENRLQTVGEISRDFVCDVFTYSQLSIEHIEFRRSCIQRYKSIEPNMAVYQLYAKE